MLYSMYILKDRIFKLTNIRKGLKKKQEDIKPEKIRTIGLFYDVLLSLTEYYHSTLLLKAQKDITSLKELYTDTEIEDSRDLKIFIDDIIDIVEDYDFEGFSNYYRLNSEYCNSVERKYDKSVFDKDILLKTIGNIKNIQLRNFNLFYINCLEANEFKDIYNISQNINMYGLEHDNDKAEKAKEYATKIAKGILNGSKFKNDAFDILMVDLNIKGYLKENMNINNVQTKEKELIYNSIRYLRKNGIVIYILPAFRMYKDICTLISKSFKNIKVFKHVLNNMPYIYIIGQKEKQEINEEGYNLLRSSSNINNILSSSDSIEIDQFILPKKCIDIDIFKGSQLDLEELEKTINTSQIYDDFFKSQNIKKTEMKKPILPFNIGQIGLVLTSGCLDGIVDEGNGYYHLVKGRVCKKVETKREINNNEMKKSETITNRVQINILLPNGDFKQLT